MVFEDHVCTPPETNMGVADRVTEDKTRTEFGGQTVECLECWTRKSEHSEHVRRGHSGPLEYGLWGPLIGLFPSHHFALG